MKPPAGNTTFRKQLLTGKTLHREAALTIAKTACTSPETFAALMDCFLSPEYRLAQRAAWCVSHAARHQPALIMPYIKVLTEQLLRNDVHPAVVRNSVRILKSITLPEENQGEAMNACFILAEKPETPIAIKAFALSMLYKLSLVYADISSELEVLAEAHLDSESPAVKSVARKIITSLHKAKTPRIHHKTNEVSNHQRRKKIAPGK